MEADFPVILFETQDDWVVWLEANGTNTSELWLRMAKKNSGVTSITYDEAVEVGLCYGWIDGLKRKYDEVSFIQRFTPRKPKSLWSLINKEKALALIARGDMKPQGLVTIENAKKHGQWDNAYEPQSTIVVPDDFEQLLLTDTQAATFFQSLNSINRFAILHRIQKTKDAIKRKEKMHFFLEMLQQGKKIY